MLIIEMKAIQLANMMLIMINEDESHVVKTQIPLNFISILNKEI